MQKTKTSFKEKIVIALACFIATAVMMVTLHLKDLVRYSAVDIFSPIKYKDISEKASEDLHSHTDKQNLKSFAKAVGDNILMSRSRDDIDATIEDDPGLFARLSEKFMIWRIYATMPFSLLG